MSEPDPKPRPYGKPVPGQPSRHCMVVLRSDSWHAVERAMAELNLSQSGAIHHLVRLGAGLPPLL